MVRRVIGIIAAGVVVVTATGCPAPPPPPPQGWVPPTVMASVSPAPVVAGEPFIIEVTAIDATEVFAIDIDVSPPLGVPSTTASSPGAICDAAELVPGPTATRSFVCVTPPLAANGQWRLDAFAASSAAPGHRGSQSSTFEVIGGEPDQTPPAIELVEVAPAPVVIGQPFAITVRASDDNHRDPSPTTIVPGYLVPQPPGGSNTWSCSPVTPTLVAPTVLEWRFTDCVVAAGSPEWLYAGGFGLEDSLGRTSRASVSFQAVNG